MERLAVIAVVTNEALLDGRDPGVAFRKLGCTSRVQAAILAKETGPA